MKLNSKIIFSLLFYCITLSAFIAQNKKSLSTIVLKKGLKRTELWKGQKLMPLYNNDTTKYEFWKNSCKTCSQLPIDSIWEIDSISKTGDLVLKHIVSYKYDTVIEAQVLTKAQRRDYRRNWKSDTIIYNMENYLATKYVYSKPDKYARTIVNINDLKGLRFAKRDICDPEERRKIPIGMSLIGLAGATLSVWDIVTFFPPSPKSVFLLVASAAYVIIGIREFNKYKIKTYHLKEWRIKIKTHRYSSSRMFK